jgi:hypothetical protein
VVAPASMEPWRGCGQHDECERQARDEDERKDAAAYGRSRRAAAAHPVAGNESRDPECVDDHV